jgi:hypothetical protein
VIHASLFWIVILSQKNSDNVNLLLLILLWV